MGFVLVDRRDRALFVTDAENGVRVFSRDARRARQFSNPGEARTWASEHLLACEYEATVLVNARPLLKKNPDQAGEPGGAICSRKISDANSAISDLTPQA